MALASASADLPFDYCLAVPMFDECWQDTRPLVEYVGSLSQRVLLIVILNSPRHATVEQIASTQQWLEDAINATSAVNNQNGPITSLRLNEHSRSELWVVNYSDSQAELNLGQARKLGADIAVSLFHKGKLVSPWVFSTDADALLPQNYFDATRRSDVSGYVYPFTHISTCATEAQLLEPHQRYELSLEHYRAGLAYAGSPYAYHSLGSCLAINIFSYAAIRGWPDREAGEDFYLLNKLAKTGPIVSLSKPDIKLRVRASLRAPFGTGPAIEKIRNDPSLPLLYHPDAFCHVKRAFEKVALNQAPTAEAEYLGQEVIQAFELSQRSSPDAEKQLRHFHQHFDALKTLKAIHFFRDNYSPALPIEAALALSPFYQDNLFEPVQARKILREKSKQCVASATRPWGVSL